MTAPDKTLARIIEVVEWSIKVALERPSNYDHRVTLNADDVLALVAAVRS